MKTKSILLVLTLSLFGLAPGNLQAQQSLSLSLDEARQYALEHNRTLTNTQFEVEKSQWAVLESIAAGLPQASAQLDYQSFMGAEMLIRFGEGMPEQYIPLRPQSNMNITLSQLVFNGNYFVGIQAARIAQDMAATNRQKSKLEVETQVIDAYNLVLITQELLRVLEMNVDNLEDLFKKTAALGEVGIIEQTDVDQLEIQLNSLKNAVNQTQRQKELAMNMLKMQLGIDPSDEVIPTNTLDEVLATMDLDYLLMTDLQLRQNFDYQLMLKQEELSKKMINMQYANALPTISAFYQHTIKIIRPDFDMVPNNAIGFSVSIPIFSSGQRYSQVKQASIDFQTTQNNRRLLEDQLKIQEKQLKFNFSNAYEAFINQKKNIEVSERVNNNIRIKYEQGMVSGLDLINADNNYLRAVNEYISSIMEMLNASTQLKKLYGQI